MHYILKHLATAHSVILVASWVQINWTNLDQTEAQRCSRNTHNTRSVFPAFGLPLHCSTTSVVHIQYRRNQLMDTLVKTQQPLSPFLCFQKRKQIPLISHLIPSKNKRPLTVYIYHSDELDVWIYWSWLSINYMSEYFKPFNFKGLH